MNAPDVSPELAACFEQGLARMEAQDWPAARAAFTRGLALDARRRGLWHNRAWCQLQLGELAAAQADLESLLQLEPGHAPGLALLGRVRLAQGDTLRGAALLARAQAADPEDGEIARQALRAALLQPGAERDAAALALALARRGQLDEPAAQELSKVLALAEDGFAIHQRFWAGLCQLPQAEAWMFEAWTQFCAVHNLPMETAVAAALWRQRHPGDAGAHDALIRALTALGDHGAALSFVSERWDLGGDRSAAVALLVNQTLLPAKDAMLVISAELERRPGDAALWELRGQFNTKLGLAQQALDDFRQAQALRPCRRHRLLVAWARALLKRHDEALAMVEAEVEPEPEIEVPAGAANLFERAMALQVVGQIRLAQRRLPQAESAFREAFALTGAGENAHGLAWTLLTMGRYAEGFALWLRHPGSGRPANDRHRALAQGARPWGGDLSLAVGRRLLVTTENGIGDTFQFARFLPWLQAQGVQVCLYTHARTGALLQTLDPPIRVLEPDAPMPAADLVCKIMDLPALLGVTLEDIGRCGPAHCLRVSDAERQAMAQRLGPRRGLRVALAWRGTRQASEERSIELAQLAALDLQGVEWFSLQQELVGDEAEAARRMGLRHEGWSFSEAAAALLNMDAVVSIDTVFCHLAGALGVPAMILLPVFADWRWGVQDPTTPWYPQARLYRQQGPADWRAPLAEIAQALTRRAAQDPSAQASLSRASS
jgi:tetratricopeptide (TPR) repeat protein